MIRPDFAERVNEAPSKTLSDLLTLYLHDRYPKHLPFPHMMDGIESYTTSNFVVHLATSPLELK